MITLKEFRDRRTTGTLTDSLAQLTFRQLFEQWMELEEKLTNAETVAYKNEARRYRDIIGIKIANEIMDEVMDKNILNKEGE